MRAALSLPRQAKFPVFNTFERRRSKLEAAIVYRAMWLPMFKENIGVEVFFSDKSFIGVLQDSEAWKHQIMVFDGVHLPHQTSC